MDYISCLMNMVDIVVNLAVHFTFSIKAIRNTRKASDRNDVKFAITAVVQRNNSG